MSAKNEKKVRKMGRREARRIIARAMKDPIWTRLKVAWRIVRGK